MKAATKTAIQRTQAERERRARVGALCSRMAEFLQDERITPQIRWHWRKGESLPTLDRFLSLCAACDVRDLTPFLEGYGRVKKFSL